jgi:hypothetical protein
VVIDGFFGEPTVSGTKQIFLEDGIYGTIGGGDGIVSGFELGFDGSGSEGIKNFATSFEGGVDAFKDFRR